MALAAFGSPEEDGHRGVHSLIHTDSPARRLGPPAIFGACVLLLGSRGPVLAQEASAFGPVLVSEVHYHPADDLRDREFVELYNRTSDPVDVGGWILTGGVTFLFPRPTVIRGGGFLVVAADPAALRAAYGLPAEAVGGPYEGSLANDGERLELWTSSGYLSSYVEYKDSDPWPETPDGLGPSLERISALREEGDPQAWAASIVVGGTPGAANSVRVEDPPPPSPSVVFVPEGDVWRFFKGRSEPPSDWAAADFDDSSWESGRAGFGYDDGDDATVLDDMRYGYSTLYIRTSFQIADPGKVESLQLRVLIDDGYIAYLNGEEIDRYNVPGSPGTSLPWNGTATNTIEPPARRQVDVSGAIRLLVPGRNVLAVEGANATLDNRDFSLDASLVGAARAGPAMAVTYVAHGEDDWRFFRGRSAPPADWTSVSFVDGDWETGRAGFGYGDDDDATVLDDMMENYLTVFARHGFQVSDASKVVALALDVDYDDGFIAYLNGVEVARANVAGPGYDVPASASHEAAGAESFAIDNPQSVLRSGLNVLAIEGHNQALDSSDFSLAPALRGTIVSDDIDPLPDPPPERPPRDVVINEVFAGSAGDGWVEMFNATDRPVDLAGSRLEVYSGSPRRWVFPPGSAVEPRGYLVVREADLGFSLSEHPNLVYASSSGAFKDGINPRTAPGGCSSGRWPDGVDDRYVFVRPTPGAANAVELETRVVVNEIQYRPADGNSGGEFIELYNRSATEAVDISSWAFTRGIDYAFPPGTAIPPRGYVVVAKDPDAAAAYYGIPRPHGPYAGRLRNDAETILLRDALKNPVDRVRYADEGSWPEAADGGGPSLELVHPMLENRWGAAWAASAGEGTPGAANSRYQADPPPIVVGVRHAPVVPSPADPVRVTAAISDDKGIVSATLFWRTDAVDQIYQVPMADDGANDDGIASNGTYGATIPPAADRTIVVFWIRAEAQGGQATVVPAGAPRPAFLYQVETPVPEPIRPVYRIVMRSADLTTLRTRGNNSNVLLDCTFVASDKAYYNRGIRYRGASARSCDPLSYRIQFDHDVDFEGFQRLNLNGCRTFRQWIGLDFLRRTGIPTPECWFRRLSVNGQLGTQNYLRVEAIDEQFLERMLPGDSGGNLYRGISQANLDYRGTSFSQYRSSYEKHSNEDLGDWSDIVDLCYRFDPETTPDELFPDAIEEVVDIDQWALYFAAYAVLGSTENSILLDNGDDYFLYRRPSDGKWILLPWDLDSCFDDENQVLFRPTVDQIERFLEHPRYAPLYWCHLEALLKGAFVPEAVLSRIDHLASLFNDSLLADLRSYVPARTSYIQSRLRALLAVSSASGGRLCGDVLYATSGSSRLDGVAPSCGTTRVRVNGADASYNPQTNAWTADVATQVGGTLRIEALDREGALVAARTLSIEAPIQQTTLPQSVSGTLTLVPANSPYRVVGTATVARGATLVVPAGVRVVFDGGAVLAVEGRLLAEGTDDAPAEFTTDACATGAEGIVFRNVGSGSALRGASLSGLRATGGGLGAGIVVEGTAVTLERSTLVGSGGGAGVLVRGNGELTLERCVVERWSQGIVVRGARATIRDAVFRTIDSGAVRFLDGSAGSIEGSIFYGCALSVVVTGGSSADLSHLTIFGSSVGIDAREEASGGLPGTVDADSVIVWQTNLPIAEGSGTVTIAFSNLCGAPAVPGEGNINADPLFRAPSEGDLHLTYGSPCRGRGKDGTDMGALPYGSGDALGWHLLCDSNADGQHDVSDAVHTLLALFAGGPPPLCPPAADCNSDGRVDMTDVIFALNFLFLAGPSPAAPYPRCSAAPSFACPGDFCAGP